MIRILLVEDHEALRYALRIGLTFIAGFDVIGEAGDGFEALLRAHELQPDLVVMDVNMPKMDGITATRCLQELVPNAVVIVHSLQDDPETKALAQEAGAAAFVTKRGSTRSLVDEILRFHRNNSNGAMPC